MLLAIKLKVSYVETIKKSVIMHEPLTDTTTTILSLKTASLKGITSRVFLENNV